MKPLVLGLCKFGKRNGTKPSLKGIIYLDHIRKFVWIFVGLLGAVTSLSCYPWQRGADSHLESSIHQIEIRYDADVLPEENDPPFVPGAECGVQSIDGGILNIEDNVSEGGSGGSRCTFYFRKDPLTSLDDAEMEFRVRVRSVGSPGGSRTVQAGFLDGTKIIHLGLSTTSVQFLTSQGMEIAESRVSVDTTVFHTYRIVKNSDVSADIFVDGELKVRLSYASLSDYSGQEAPRLGFGAGSSWGTSNSDWDFFNYNISRSPTPDDSQVLETLDISQKRLQQDDREPKYLTNETANNLERPRMVLLEEIRFVPPESLSLHMGLSPHMHDVAIGPTSFFLLNSRDTVSEFGPDGRFIRHYGEKLRNQLELGPLRGWALNPRNGRLYVSETRALTIFKPDGSFGQRIEFPEIIAASAITFSRNGDLLLDLCMIDGPWLAVLKEGRSFTLFGEERRKLLSPDQEFRPNFMPRFHTLTDSSGNIYAINRVDYEIRKYDQEGVYIGDFNIQQDRHYRPPPDGVDKSRLWTDPEFQKKWYSTWTGVTGAAIASDRFLVLSLGSLGGDGADKTRLHIYGLQGRKLFRQIEWDERLAGSDSDGRLYFYSKQTDSLRVYALEPSDLLIRSRRSKTLDEGSPLEAAKSGPGNLRSESEKIPAPSFRVTSLAGEKLESRSLRGKVVVLNFWFIGCAPCRAEIPSLNTLVDGFAQDEVEFIAFAKDGEVPLRSFLEELPFKYKIIPAATDVIRKFNVNTYPTHIIIDQKGNIDTVLFGGGENRHEDLHPLIRRLLLQTP